MTGRYVVENAVTRPKRSDPATAPTSDPMPPMITTTSELSSQTPSWPCEMLPCEVPTVAPSATSAAPTANAIANVTWMLIPSAEVICRSSTPGADHHAGLRPIEPQPERDPDRRPERQHHEPRQRVLDAPDVEVDEPARPPRPADADGVPAEGLGALGDVPREVGDHLVGDDQRDGDRDERLPEVLALVPAEKQLLHRQAEDARSRPSPRAAAAPTPTCSRRWTATEKP